MGEMEIPAAATEISAGEHEAGTPGRHDQSHGLESWLFEVSNSGLQTFSFTGGPRFARRTFGLRGGNFYPSLRQGSLTRDLSRTFPHASNFF